MAAKINCPNMNHGRGSISIRYCPDCGELLNAAARSSCNEELHAARRKNRNLFCHDCGKKISTITPLKR